MDVKCENCGTEYEFDDAKVTVAGITVKCTHCGHLFRVARPAAPDAPAAAPATSRNRHWMIRNRHGEIREFRDLSTLQQWIVARKVSRDDEISKTGETWKKLGSIVELAGVFSAVDAAGAVGVGDLFSSPAGDLQSSAPPSAKPPPFSPDEVIPTGKFTLEGPRRIPAGIDEAPTVRVTRQQRTPAPLHSPIQPPAAPKPEPRTLTLPELQQSSYTPAADPQSGRGFLLGVMTTLALAGIGYFIYDTMVRPKAGPAPVTQPGNSAQAVVERGEGHYQQDTEAGFARADADFAKALVQLGDPPPDVPLAVRAHLGRARVALARADYERLRDGGDPSQHLKVARVALDEAERLDPTSGEARLLRADLHGVAGRNAEARALLADLQVPAKLADQKLLIEASLPMRRGAWLEARTALAKLPKSALDRPRARFLYATALARSGRTQDAIFEAERLLTRQPDHDAAQRLLKTLRPATGPKTVKAVIDPAPASAPSAPASVAAVTAAPSSAAPASAAPPSVASTAPASKAPPKRRRLSFDGLMKSARKAQENGRTTQARRLLLQALGMKPGNAEALSSLGWCDVDDGAFRRAISYFRRALQRAPGFADARYGLAVALERSGSTTEAKRIYTEYLKKHPSGRRRRIVERKVKTL